MGNGMDSDVLGILEIAEGVLGRLEIAESVPELLGQDENRPEIVEQGDGIPIEGQLQADDDMASVLTYNYHDFLISYISYNIWCFIAFC